MSANHVSAALRAVAEKESAVQKKQSRLDAQRQKQFESEVILRRRAGLADNLDTVTAQCNASCLNLKHATEFTDAQFVYLLNGGHKVEDLMIRLVVTDVFKKRLPKIESLLRQTTVEPAAKALADFQREHRKILKKFPPLKREEPLPFVPPLPVDDDAAGAAPKPPSREVLVSLGISDPKQIRLSVPVFNAGTPVSEEDGGPNAISD